MSVCADLRRRIVAFLDGELSDAEAATVASHLESCDACSAARAQLVAARRLLFEVPAPAPDPRAWTRIRREIHPRPVSRAIRRTASFPIPLWAAGSMAAGVLAFAVLVIGGAGSSGHAGRTRGNGPDHPTTVASADRHEDVVGRAGRPGDPGVWPTDRTANPMVDRDVTPNTSQPAPPTSRQPSTVVQTPGPQTPVTSATSTVPAEPPARGGGGARVDRDSDPTTTPTGPATPATRPWESQAMSVENRPRALPGRPTYVSDASPFDPDAGVIPLPRGSGEIAVHVNKDGDLLFDRVGRGRRADVVAVTRRKAQKRDGVRRNLLIQHGTAKPQPINVTFTRNRLTGQWFLRNNTARYGKWMGEYVVVIDGNNNGTYNDVGVGHDGTDAVYFNKRRQVVPMSEVLVTARGLVEFQVDVTGGRFRTRAYDGPVGQVALQDRFAGRGQLTSAVIATGDYAFDIRSAQNASIALPCGTYKLAGGTFQSAKVRMRILTGSYEDFEVGSDQVATISLGGRCNLGIRLDGNPEAGHLSVAYTSVSVQGELGEVYEPVGRGLQRVRFALRSKLDGRLVWEQAAAVTRCPRNGHERFAVKLPNKAKAEDLKVQMFAPAYEQMFGSVACAYAGE